MSSFDGVAALLRKHAPPPRPELPEPDEIRRMVTRAAFHRPGKKRRTAAFVLANLKREYDRQPSLQAVADIMGVSKSHVFYLLKRNGIARRSKQLRPRVVHNGLTYAFDGRYWCQCGRGKQGILLHKVIWQEEHGPVPAGHRLILCGPPGDYRNVRCVPLREYFRHVVAQRWAKRTDQKGRV